MLFNSYIFLFAFLPLSLVLYYWLRRSSGKELAFLGLVICSLVFYAYWKLEYLPLLLFSIVGNYAAGYFLSNKQNTHRKAVLITGIISNLSLLIYFKYTNFLIQNITLITGDDYSSINIVLPLAISFFTFQQIAYLVDTYKGEAEEYSFSHYCLFVTFFPQLIAGPIVHHKEMLPQFVDDNKKHFDSALFVEGSIQFILGLFKKVVIADNAALYATPVFTAADQGLPLTMPEAWIGVLAYSFQLYFDFSAYSDMAIGVGKMFGINLPKNFNSPYKATSVVDFWRRWHMTLSRFLRDYLYIALGGNRHGNTRRYINLFLTMLLGGLWHGASWNFVLWGGLHGTYLIINHGWEKVKKRLNLSVFESKLYKFISIFLTFYAVIHAWVLFRAVTFSGAMEIFRASYDIKTLYTSSGEAFVYLNNPFMAIITLALCALIAFTLPNSQEFVESKRLKQVLEERSKIQWQINAKWTVRFGVPLLLVISVASMNKVSEFLYFQF